MRVVVGRSLRIEPLLRIRVEFCLNVIVATVDDVFFLIYLLNSSWKFVWYILFFLYRRAEKRKSSNLLMCLKLLRKLSEIAAKRFASSLSSILISCDEVLCFWLVCNCTSFSCVGNEIVFRLPQKEALALMTHTQATPLLMHTYCSNGCLNSLEAYTLPHLYRTRRTRALFG